MLVYIFNDLLVHFVTIWYILWSFGIFCGHLVFFVVIWYLEPRKIWQSYMLMSDVATENANWSNVFASFSRWLNVSFSFLLTFFLICQQIETKEAGSLNIRFFLIQ
jgi:hypothetical protein